LVIISIFALQTCIMKNLKWFSVCLAATILSSCLDTEEKIVLNADNSGNYSMTLDLGRMLKMAGSMAGANSDESKPKEKKDTTIYFKDLVDTATALNAEEKALYRDAQVQVHLDEEHEEMMIVMSSPFKNSAALTAIKNGLPAIMNKLQAFEKVAGDKDKADPEGDELQMGGKSANPVGDQFNFKAAPGKITNTIKDIEAFKKLVTADSTFSMMTQMSGMMGDFNYRTTIVLPKAAKNYTGPGSIASPDKKTISFATTLAEMLEHPEKVSYSIEY
jgi:hypothetical protein